eukprot:TRINITY_DN14770_c1_g2_i1.p1 TRINITY_DN14770_c1_g2~~TRINITY_DN14770_c1_g2_i1.p1  ORF type:complete len:1136 (+),score=418.54 TRINITY_DN14770_c1_g2_i1:137-3409(+)
MSESQRRGINNRRSSWVGTLLPARGYMRAGSASRDNKRIHSRESQDGFREEGKGDGDDMAQDRRERLDAHMRKGGKDLDHLGLRNFRNLVDTLARREKDYAVAGWRPEGAPQHAKASSKHQSCCILFSARNAPLLDKAQHRAVCVTERAVHLLAFERTAGLDAAKAGNYRVLHSFELTALVSIITSKNDPLSVCLDFRMPDGDGRRVQDRTPILAKLPDASYVIFAFREKDKAEVAQSVSTMASAASWIGGIGEKIGHSLPQQVWDHSDSTHTAKKREEKEALTYADEFIGVLYHRFWPVPAEHADDPKAVLVALDTFTFRAVDDAQRAISKVVRKGQLQNLLVRERGPMMVSLMPSNELDKLHVAQDASAVKALRAEGDQKIVFSCEIETLNRHGKVKAGLAFIVTDKALYYVSRTGYDKIIRRVELQHINKIYLDNNSSVAQEKTFGERQWQALIQLDLANDRSTKDFSSDLLFQIRVKAIRDLLARAIQAVYESLVINRLEVVEDAANVRSLKRGKLEAWITSLQGAGVQKLLMDWRTEESLRWLVFLLKYKLRFLLSTLTEVLPMNEMHLFARSVVRLCEDGKVSNKLLTDVVNVEMDTNASPTTFFRNQSLSTAILKEYVSGMDRERNVEEFLNVVLFPALDAFDKANPTVELAGNGGNVHELWRWTDAFYDSITSPASAAAMPHEMRRVVRVFHDVCRQRDIDPGPYMGGYLMLRVFSPAITAPHYYNLGKAPEPHRHRQLLLIARLLQSTVNKVLIDEHIEPGLAHAMNWWLRRYGGLGGPPSATTPPPEYTQYHGAYPRATWDEYVQRLVDSIPPPEDSVPEEKRVKMARDTQDIARLVEEADFMDDWSNTHVLATVHSRLCMYTEQILSILWNTTGRKKRQVAELELSLERLNAGDLDDIYTDTEHDTGTRTTASPVQGSPAGSGRTGSSPHRRCTAPGFAAKSSDELAGGHRRATHFVGTIGPDGEGASTTRSSPGSVRHSLFLHRSALRQSPRQRCRLSLGVSTPGAVTPRAPQRARFTRSSDALEVPVKTPLMEKAEALREKEEYVAYLEGLLVAKDLEYMALVEEDNALEAQIAACG